MYGDPATPVLEAFLGDPVVVRALVAGTNDLHTWHVDGHWFRVEPFIMRVLPAGADATLRPLPGCSVRRTPRASRSLSKRSMRPFRFWATRQGVRAGQDRAALVSGEHAAEPLVLHANVGDCIVIELSNRTSAPQGAVSMHADMLAYDPRDSAGVQVGRNAAGQAVAPGQSRTLTF